MLIDVSMKSLRRKLDEDGELLQHVAQIWSIDQAGQDAAATRELLLERTDDPIAARSVWERLSPNARLCLFHTFGSGNPSGIGGLTRESLRQKTKLSPEEFSEAILSLKDRWYLVDEEALPSNVSVLGKDVHASAPELIIFPFRECVESLRRTGQELFRASADRTLYQQQHFLSIMHQDRLQKLAHLCHVQTHSAVSTSSYNAHPSISHPLEVHKRVYEAMQHPLIPFELLHRLDPQAQRVFLWLCEQEEGKARMDELTLSRFESGRFLFPPSGLPISIATHE